MDHTIQSKDEAVEVFLKGSLTYLDHDRFRHIIEVFSENFDDYIVNVNDLDFIDSAGLGMLLIARDKVFERNKNVVLKGAVGQVRKMIELSQFDTLFLVEA